MAWKPSASRESPSTWRTATSPRRGASSSSPTRRATSSTPATWRPARAPPMPPCCWSTCASAWSSRRGAICCARGPELDWFEGPTLLERLESLDSAADQAAAGALRFPVQLVSRPQGDSARSYLGRIESGTVSVGDEVLVLPGARRTRVREIVVQGAACPIAAAGDSVSLALADDIDIARGDLIVDPRSAPREARALEATLVWLDADPMHASGRYLVHQAGRRTLARIKEVASRRDVHTLEERPTDGSIGTNDIVRAKLALQSPLFVDSYDAVRATGSFILIDEATNRTVAAGMVR